MADCGIANSMANPARINTMAQRAPTLILPHLVITLRP
jgi:hypothetical protein